MNQPRRTLTAERFVPEHQMLSIHRVTEAFRLPRHAHDFIELAYVGEGRGFHYIEDEVRPAARGQLFVIPVGVSHVFRPVSPDAAAEPLVVYNCIFEPKLIDRLLPLATEEPIISYMKEMQQEQASCKTIADDNADVETLLLAMYRECELPQTGSPAYLLSLLLQLLLTMYRLEHRESAGVPAKHDRFVQVLGYVERHYAEELTLARLAQTFKWSERQLQRLFNRHTSQTFQHYLQSVRVRKSCEQLRHSDRTVAAIAESVGYRDVNSFISLFKRITGQTPGSYRKQSSTL